MEPTKDGVMQLIENRNKEIGVNLIVANLRGSTLHSSSILLYDGQKGTQVTLDYPPGQDPVQEGKIKLGCLVHVSEWTVKKHQDKPRHVFIQKLTVLATSTSFSTPSPPSLPTPKHLPPLDQRPILPLSTLNDKVPDQNWKVEIRVTGRLPIKEFKSARGNGSVANVMFVDQQGTEMRAVMYGTETKTLYPQLVVGMVFWISEAVVQRTNKKFNPNGHDFELVMRSTTVVSPVLEERSLPKQVLNFKSIASLDQLPPSTLVDVLVVIQAVGELGSIFSKKLGEQLTHRQVVVTDTSGKCIELKLWGKQAELAGSWIPGHDILSLKNTRVDIWQNTLQLSTSFDTIITLNPEHPNVAQLRDLCSRSEEKKGGVEWKHLDEITTSGNEGKAPEIVWTIATVSRVYKDSSKPPYYLACGADEESQGKRQNCKKKAVPNSNLENGWERCPFCNRSFESPTPRFILNFSISDMTAQVSVTAFEKVAEQLLEVNASHVQKLVDTQNTMEYSKLLDGLLYKSWQCKLKISSEVINDQRKTKMEVIEMQPIDFHTQSNRLIALSSS